MTKSIDIEQLKGRVISYDIGNVSSLYTVSLLEKDREVILVPVSGSESLSMLASKLLEAMSGGLARVISAKSTKPSDEGTLTQTIERHNGMLPHTADKRSEALARKAARATALRFYVQRVLDMDRPSLRVNDLVFYIGQHRAEARSLGLTWEPSDAALRCAILNTTCSGSPSGPRDTPRRQRRSSLLRSR